jgi:threonine dehydrogenase-like Zn-dependent dehydrogenase
MDNLIPTSMKAVIWNGPLEVQVKTVPTPQLETMDDSVIVKTILMGLCGSDLHPFRGHEPGLRRGSVFCGHELVGIVIAKGKNVKLNIGDRVASPFTTSCSKCWACQSTVKTELDFDSLQLTCRCTEGRLFGWISETDSRNPPGLQGCQAEFVRIPLADSTLVVVPNTLSDELSLLLGDVLPTGLFACLQGGVSTKRDNSMKIVVIVGCGPIGLVALAWLRSVFKVSQIIAIDGVKERLELAKEMADATVDYTIGDAVKQVEALIAHPSKLPDVVIECVGSTSALALAYKLVRPGGILSVVGAHNASGQGSFGFSPSDHYDKNMTLRIGRCPARALMDPILELLQQQHEWMSRLANRIITHRMRLDDAVEAYHMFDNKLEGCIKVVFH